MLNDNRTYELLVLFREERKLRHTTFGQVLKTGIIALVVLTLIGCGIAGGVRAYRRHVGRMFLETLYTVTEEDLIDPQERVNQLYDLADDKFVDELLRGDRIPAVYFHEQNISMTATFDAESILQQERRSDQQDILYIPGSVTLHHDAAHYGTAPNPAFILSFDGTTVADMLTPGLRWKAIARAEWD